MEIEGWIAQWNEQTENKRVPKLRGLIWWITSTTPNLPTHVSLSFDILSLLSHPHRYTFAHLLANESFHFQLKCHSRRATAAHQENNKPSDLCLYSQPIKKERTKNYFVRLSALEDSYSESSSSRLILPGQAREKKGSKDKSECLLWSRRCTFTALRAWWVWNECWRESVTH